jgi:hypothetical protein
MNGRDRPLGRPRLIGTAGFEPATPATPLQCATGLRYVPELLRRRNCSRRADVTPPPTLSQRPWTSPSRFKRRLPLTTPLALSLRGSVQFR